MTDPEVQSPPFSVAAAAANNTPFAPISPSLHLNNKVSCTAGHYSPVSSLRPQSCFLCRRRKVRCNKESPCSTCRRAQVPCIYPVGRAPRQTRIRRHGTQSMAESDLAEKVSMLELMIEKLGDRINGEPGLESAVPSIPSRVASHTQTCTPKDSPSHSLSPETHCQELERDELTTDPGHSVRSHELQHKLGRLVLHEESGSKRYVCDGIWAKLDEEVIFPACISSFAFIHLKSVVDFYSRRVAMFTRQQPGLCLLESWRRQCHTTCLVLTS
jgi:hypothetical protein